MHVRVYVIKCINMEYIYNVSPHTFFQIDIYKNPLYSENQHQHVSYNKTTTVLQSYMYVQRIYHVYVYVGYIPVMIYTSTVVGYLSSYKHKATSTVEQLLHQMESTHETSGQYILTMIWGLYVFIQLVYMHTRVQCMIVKPGANQPKATI